MLLFPSAPQAWHGSSSRETLKAAAFAPSSLSSVLGASLWCAGFFPILSVFNYFYLDILKIACGHQMQICQAS